MPPPDFARPHKAGSVQTQRPHSDSPCRSLAYDSSRNGSPAKVVIPIVDPGVKEGDDTTSATVERLNMGMLVGVTPETAKTQIIKVTGTATREGNNMVDSESVSGIFHARPTILAEPLPSLLDTPTQGGRESAHRKESSASARRSMMLSHSRKRPVSSRRSMFVRRHS